MLALTPPIGFTTLKKDMDRLFERLWEGEFPELRSMGEWAPALDVSETKDALVVKAEVPGIDPREIHVSLRDQLLTIKGEKKQEKEEQGEQYYRVERAYGAFARSVRLPVAVGGEKMRAIFKNGLLTITLPKTGAAKGTTIPIQAE